MKNLLAVLRNRNIALLLFGRFVSICGDWVYNIGLMLAIYQYSHGKTYFIGFFWLARLIPGLMLGPFAGALADRLGYRRAMITADLGRMVLVSALALLLTPSSWVLIYPVVVLVTIGNSLFNPSSIGLIPRLVSSTEERLRANATIMQAASLGVIIGSAVGGVAVGIGYRELLLIDATTFLVSAICLTFVVPKPAEPVAAAASETAAEEELAGGPIAAVKLLASRPVLVFIASVMAMPELVSGAIPVWIVPYAEHAVHLPSSGAGYLYTAIGVGAIVGGLVASSLGSNLRLDSLLAGSVALGGLALGLCGVIPVAVLAFVFLAGVGLFETVEYAAYETLLQQAVPASMIGRAAGTMESYLFNMVLIGNLLGGFLVVWLGVSVTIAGSGLLTLLATGAAWWYFRVRTAGQPDALALERVPAFQAVPLDVREWAVRRMERLDFPAGAVVIRQGDVGDMFYTIARGKADVEVSADGATTHRTLEQGDYFGEIALLQNVPRTATVRADSPLTVWGLTREDFDELQRRASEFRESLEETAAERLGQQPNALLLLPARG